MFNRILSKEKKGDAPEGAEKDPHALIEEKLKERMSRIKRKILVLSGKGGVGKSTVAVNLAAALASKGFRTGLLDTDLHGPSIPTLLGLNGAALSADPNGNIFPIPYGENLLVISIGFMLQGGDEPVVWRGPLKYSAIRQFLAETLWGDLDYLVIDSPPGTGDEPLSVCQLIPAPRGAVIVTTPQDVALSDVRRSITFCAKLDMPVYGVVENMSGLACPHCGKRIDVFKTGGGESMADDMGVPFLGSIPLDPEVTKLGDEGKPFVGEAGPDSAKRPFMEITEAIIQSEDVR
jgi:Mrp family chromosome partitioning ATPase